METKVVFQLLPLFGNFETTILRTPSRPAPAAPAAAAHGVSLQRREAPQRAGAGRKSL